MANLRKVRGNFFKTALALVTTLAIAIASYTLVPAATAAVSPIASSFQVPDQSLGFLLQFEEGDQEAENSNAALRLAIAAAPTIRLSEAKPIGLGWYAYGYGIESPSKTAILKAVNAALTAPGVKSVAFDFKVEAARALMPAKVVPVKTWGLAPLTSTVKLTNGFEVGDPTDGKIKVTWKRPTTSAKVYQVAYSTSKYSGFRTVTVSSSSYRPSVKIGGLTPGTRYYFKVRVKYSSSRYSNYTSTVYGQPTVQPYAVKLISSSRFTSTTSVTTQWFPLTTLAERGGASTVTYRMDVYNSSNDGFVGSCLPTSNTYCTKDQLPLGNYYAKVYAINSVGETATNVSTDNFGYQSLWYLTGTKGINVKPAWALSQGGVNTVTVAVIDTGFTNAPVLKANSWWDSSANHFYGYDFVDNTLDSPSNDGNGVDNDPSDPGDYCQDLSICNEASDSSWHGTQVASVLAGYTNVAQNALTSSVIDSNSSIGVAPRVKLLAVRALGPTGGSTSEITAAINWAAGVQIPGIPLNIHPAKVINLSMGTSGVQACDSYESNALSPTPYASLSATQKFQNQLTYTGDAILEAKNNGVIFTTAAGNWGHTYMRAVSSYPGNCYGTINVGATGKTGTRSWYSNLGSGSAEYSGVDLSAPGGDSHLASGGICDQASCITVTLNSGTTTPTATWNLGVNEGTSFAAPVVAGVVAMMVSIDPRLDLDTAVGILSDTATPFTSVTCTTQLSPTYFECGVGIVNAGAALQAVVNRLAD